MSNLRKLKDRSPSWVKAAADHASRRYALATVRNRAAPDFLIIGTKRGGTTSLFNYLLMHPGVLGLFPESRGKKSTDYFFREPDRGDAWYRSHFHSSRYRRLIARRLGYVPVSGEASPYYMWDPRVAAKAAELAPGLKAIALLRDPVERAWSHYQERVQNGVEPLGFEAALEAEEARTRGELDRMLADPRYYSEAHDFYSYKARGVYLPQLRNWLSAFPREQLLVIRSEDMYEDVQAVFDVVCDFLSIDRHALPVRRRFNARHQQSAMSKAARDELVRHFGRPNGELERFLGRSMNWRS